MISSLTWCAAAVPLSKNGEKSRFVKSKVRFTKLITWLRRGTAIWYELNEFDMFVIPIFAGPQKTTSPPTIQYIEY